MNDKIATYDKSNELLKTIHSGDKLPPYECNHLIYCKHCREIMQAAIDLKPCD